MGSPLLSSLSCLPSVGVQGPWLIGSSEQQGPLKGWLCTVQRSSCLRRVLLQYSQWGQSNLRCAVSGKHTLESDHVAQNEECSR